MRSKSTTAVALACGLFLVACGNKESAETGASDPGSDTGTAAVEAQPDGVPLEIAGDGNPPPGEMYQPPVETHAAEPTALVQAQAVQGVIHPFMTQQLRMFILEKGRMPSDFSEFANARMDSVPFPPDGMEYVIDPAEHAVKMVKIQQ